MRRFALQTTLDTPPFSEAELDQFIRQFRRWERHGGLVLLPRETTLIEYPRTPAAPIPDGCSIEGSDWAKESLCWDS